MSASKIEIIGSMILFSLWSTYYVINGVRIIRERKMIYVFPFNLGIWVGSIFIGRDRVVNNYKNAFPDYAAIYWGWMMLIVGGMNVLVFLYGIIMTFLDM